MRGFRTPGGVRGFRTPIGGGSAPATVVDMSWAPVVMPSTTFNLAGTPLATGWTPNGDTDGGWELNGLIYMPGTTGTYYWQPNADAVAAHYRFNQIYTQVPAVNSTAAATGGSAGFVMGGASTAAGVLSFTLRQWTVSGKLRKFSCEARRYITSTDAQLTYLTVGEYLSTATVFDGTSRIVCTAAGGIDVGSQFSLRRLLNPYT